MSLLRKFLTNESGTTTVEYGLVLIAVTLAIAVGLEQAGTNLTNVLIAIGEGLFSQV